MMASESQEVRSDFPILQRPLNKGQRVVYLDSASTAQKPQQVVDKEREVYENYYANAYRGVYRFGARVDEELEATRAQLASWIKASRPDEIVFTAGSTTALNLAAFGWGRKHLEPGNEIVINQMEHHANFVPWQQLARQTGCELKFLPLTSDGRLDMDRWDEVVNRQTRIVAVTAMSNVLGTINPIQEISRRAHEVGAIVVVDGAQSAPHQPTDVQQLGADFLAFSSHKVFGPSGVGVLYGRYDLLQETDPIVFGGHMIDRVTMEESTWADPPARFEAGTPPIAQGIALGAALDYIESIGFERILSHEKDLVAYAHEQLEQIPGMKIFGPGLEHKGAIVSFQMEGAHPEDVAQLLDRKGVFVRHGHHCTMPLHDWLGITASIRASFAVYNTREDVDALVDGLHFAREKLRLA